MAAALQCSASSSSFLPGESSPIARPSLRKWLLRRSCSLIRSSISSRCSQCLSPIDGSRERRGRQRNVQPGALGAACLSLAAAQGWRARDHPQAAARTRPDRRGTARRIRGSDLLHHHREDGNELVNSTLAENRNGRTLLILTSI